MTIKQRPEAKMEMRFVLFFSSYWENEIWVTGITNQKITQGFMGMGNRLGSGIFAEFGLGKGILFPCSIAPNFRTLLLEHLQTTI